MRWNKCITFLTPARAFQDDEGGTHYGTPEKRTVFCNENSIGTMTMAHLRSSEIRMANSNEPIDVGMRHEHMIEVKAIDYCDEDRCIFECQEYEVLAATGAGDRRFLIIGQRIGNMGTESGNV